MLGWHGIRRSLDEQELLKPEFQAIKRLHEEGLTKLIVIFLKVHLFNRYPQFFYNYY